jgi:small-conductance mechanosensitive channel
VAVASGCDPDQVIAILTKCAEEHPLVLPNPPPGATLESFGDSALTFNLRISVADIDKANGVQSDLRIAIVKALREEGIGLPANQLDVTLNDLDTMRRYLSETLGRPAGAPGSGGSEAVGGEQKLSAVKGR